jgi:hypothetical protein
VLAVVNVVENDVPVVDNVLRDAASQASERLQEVQACEPSELLKVPVPHAGESSAMKVRKASSMRGTHNRNEPVGDVPSAPV